LDTQVFSEEVYDEGREVTTRVPQGYIGDLGLVGSFGHQDIIRNQKDRWEKEIFFKTLKQNLKVKTFVGTSENALYIQIWTALIAMLIIKYLHHLSMFSWSLSNLVSLLHWNLFTYRDLREWLNDPFETRPAEPELVQESLPLPATRVSWRR